MASSYKIGGRIVLDGEREYKKALSDINSDLKVNYSAMKKAAAEYDNAGDSQKDMSGQMKALDAAIDTQTKKVETLRGALAHSIQTNGESSKTTLKYRENLNLAEADLAKMNGQMKKYTDGTKTATTGTTSVGDAVRQLASAFGVNLPPAIDGILEKFDGISVKGVAVTAVLAGIITKMGKLTLSTAQTADDLLTLSKTTGLSTDTLQEFNYASGLLDVDTQTMTGSLTKLIRTMGDAGEGSGTATKAFKKLGVNVKDSNGHLRDAEDVYWDVIDALGGMNNATERDSIAMDILGKSARELNPLIEAGSGRFRELATEAQNTGYVMSGETLDAFGRLQDGVDMLHNKFTAVKQTLAEALLPVLTIFAEAINAIPTPVLTAVTAIGGMVLVIATLAKGIQTVTEITKVMKTVNLAAAASNTVFGDSAIAMGTASKTAAAGFVPLLGKIGIFVAVAAAAIGIAVALALAIASVVKAISNGTSFTEEWGNNVDILKQKFSDITGAFVPKIDLPKYAYGTRFHKGGLAVVGERGPEIVDMPQGSKVYPNGTNIGGDTFIFNVKLDEIGDVQKLLGVANRAKSSRRRGVVNA